MSDLLIQNIDDKILHQLKKNAESTGIPAESQVVSILRSTLLQHEQPLQDDILDMADYIRNKHAHRQTTDSTSSIREDRNSR